MYIKNSLAHQACELPSLIPTVTMSNDQIYIMYQMTELDK